MFPAVRTLLLIASIFAFACCSRKAAPAARSGPMEPSAFWVWHRSSPLSGEEIAKLRIAGTKDLCWQAVECGWEEGRWKSTRISRPPPVIPGITITPVFRIKPDASFLDDPSSAPLLAKMAGLWSEGAAMPGIQLDFDCPDRLLAVYAKFIGGLRKQLPDTRISITALAAWPRQAGFRELARSVDMMMPMFYDLHADKAADARASRFHPLADPADSSLIALWKDCPAPWLAGLPNFERLSVFLPDGTLSGHLRGWSHDELFFNPGLVPHPIGGGITLHETSRPASIAGTAVAAGSRVVHRMPSLEILSRMKAAAESAGARGVIYFALPGPGLQVPYTAADLTGNAAPRFVITTSPEGAVTISNEGPGDLPPRACDPATGMKGWWIEGTSSSPGAFRSGSPGGFPMASTPSGEPAEITRILRLHFSKLAAGESITSGLLTERAEDITWSPPAAR